MYLSIKAYSKQSYFEFYYKLGGLKKSFSENILFDQLKFNDLQINFYKNLTILFTYNQKLNQDIIGKIEILIDKRILIGSDEVGVGEKIGPIITCAGKFDNFSQKKTAILETGGIKDSKKLSAQEIKTKSKIIKKYFNYKCIIIEPNKFNQLLKEGKNTKEINALMHHKLHNYFIKENAKEIFVVDKFVNENKYFEYLERNKQTKIKQKIIFIEKGEDKYLEIAASAIIAKDKYNTWIYNYLNKHHLNHLLTGKKVNTNQIANNIASDQYKDLFKDWKNKD